MIQKNEIWKICGTDYRDMTKYLLAETDLPMSQISQLLGFSSLSYFSQVFRRSQNESPMEYRKNTRRL